MSLCNSLKVIGSTAEKEAFLVSLCAVGKPTVVSFLNAHALNLAQKNIRFTAHLREADYLLRDGIGITVLMRVLGKDPGLNMNGTDLIPEIIERFKGRKIALCGTLDPWLAKAAEHIKNEMGQRIIVCLDGFQDHHVYIEELQQKKPDLIILAMGMPRQEELADKLARTLDFPVVVINGGAILDFMAERFPRAPAFWRRIKLEWAFRFFQEPFRLFGRYILGGFSFSLLMVKLKVRERKGAS
ncbi:WecB/TagA/CpsF family glycosyltransferase [Pseudodesulfovibrio sediminis]|uniref:UDP-N-acetyl-D-mannosaminuronic acid transferase n=1 Tax=Pseudodesulfovibrio sediminis TaxID=2810563 RepID=A0ABM7P6X0_9BACT|nr:WecB/TagA/CpsF family glycosyltransferase [Pseudodesulfovibrio sediminis]BCS89116.1 UDP-N-acetyl-D-mannosaminuronic acid transferase [Pseudodesulfovibrio sediminis]